MKRRAIRIVCFFLLGVAGCEEETPPAPLKATWGRNEDTLAASRITHTATTIESCEPSGSLCHPGGAVLVLGGNSGIAGINNFGEVFDPSGRPEAASDDEANPSWAPVYDNDVLDGNGKDVARNEHQATTLPDGRVLISGGTYAESMVTHDVCPEILGMESCPMFRRNTIKLYDPKPESHWSGGFSPKIDVTFARAKHTVTLLPRKDETIPCTQAETIIAVLVGGVEDRLLDDKKVTTAGVEILEYKCNFTIQDDGALHAGDIEFSAPSIKDDPGFLEGHTATLLTPTNAVDANVYEILVLGGRNAVNKLQNAWKVKVNAKSPHDVSWTALNVGDLPPREGHIAARLTDGKVLIAGGQGTDGAALSDSWLYDPTTDTFEKIGAMTRPRAFAASTTLTAKGWVVVTGGLSHSGTDNAADATAEYLDVSSRRWISWPTMHSQRAGHTIAAVHRYGNDCNADWLVVVGGSSSSSLESAKRTSEVLFPNDTCGCNSDCSADAYCSPSTNECKLKTP